MIKILRHGDLGLVPIEQLPKEIKTKASGSKVIMVCLLDRADEYRDLEKYLAKLKY